MPQLFAKCDQPNLERRARLPVLLTWLCTATTPALADHTRIKGLLDLELPELMQVRALSMSKQSQSVWDAAAAMSVITQADIQAAGATTIADALRLVPGVQVGQIDASGYAISIRGFSSRIARKTLVMIDGRTIYSQGFSGTFWEVRDLPVQIVDQIEVQRGPGGSLWGSNAMNGVINIITKPAHKMTGTELSLGSGTEQPGIGFASWGGRLTDHMNARFHASVKAGDDFWLNGDAPDEYLDRRAGFRLDSEGKPGSVTTFEGEYFRRDGGIAPPFFSTETDGETAGGHLLARWRLSGQNGATHQWQTFIDHTHVALKALGCLRETIADLDYQFNYTGWNNHDLVMGAGYRHIRDNLKANAGGGSIFAVSPIRAQQSIEHIYAQDRIHLPYGLHATLGARLERNDHSGTEAQPTVRIDWAPRSGSTVWGSWSSATRIPSRFEAELQNRPNPNLDAETLKALEFGFRHRVSRHATLEFSAFRNHYDDLIKPQIDLSTTPPTLQYQNAIRGETRGYEIEGRWQPRAHWELRSGYSRLNMAFENKPGFNLFAANLGRPIEDILEKSDPKHRAFVQSRNDIGRHWKLNSTLRYVSRLDGPTAIPSYTELDLAAAWKPRDDFSLDLIGRNLLDAQHPEASGSPFTGNTEIERSVLVRGTWKY